MPSSSPSAGTSPLRLAEGDLSAWQGLEKEGESHPGRDGPPAEARLEGGPQNFIPAFSGNIQVDLSLGLWQGLEHP